VKPAFRIARTDSVFAIGSCFAQEVQEKLARLGLNVATRMHDENTPAHERAMFMQGPLNGQAGVDRHFWPMHFFHRYTPASLAQELKHLAGEAPEIEAGALLYRGQGGEWRDYHYHHAFPLPTKDACVERRAYVRARYGAALRNADLVVMTLGLIESWIDNACGLVTNTPPPFAECARHRDGFHFQRPRPDVVLRQVRECVETVRRVAPQARIVVTVSPIPLEATFTGDDVSSATMRGKATLLAMAREVIDEFAEDTARDCAVQYFPSYEMATLSDRGAVWADDQRHVRPEFVAQIMGHFVSTFVDDAPAAVLSPPLLRPTPIARELQRAA
jgi:hypothetical protein